MSSEEIFDLIQELEEHRKYNKISYYSPYDFQKAFHHSTGVGEFEPVPSDREKTGLAIHRALMCANQIGKCNSISTYIDTSMGRKRLWDVWGKSDIEVLTYPDMAPRKVSKWVRKPPEECFRVTMSDGQWFESPRGHLILTDSGWLSLGQIFQLLPESVFYRHQSSSALGRIVRALGVLRYMRNIRDYLGDCLVDSRLDGGQLLSDQDNVQVYLPLQGDALQHSARLWRLGVQACRYTCSLFGRLLRHSSPGVSRQTWGRFALPSGQVFSFSSQDKIESSRNARQSYSAECRHLTFDTEYPHQSVSFSSVTPVIEGNEIVSVYSVGVKTLYDMEVEERHNYIAGGLVHHNTYCGASETAMHLTGIYPDWWEGHRFPFPVKALVGSNTNETARDICQRELFGDPSDDKALGSGAVPKDLIVKTNRKPGVNNAFDSVLVKHASGGHSEVYFRAYEQGPKKFMGHRYDWAWLDEEPPSDIWSQVLRSQFATNGVSAITFTPEEGVTEVVNGFVNDLKPGQSIVRATWDDAPHMTPELREQKLASVPAHERDMRAKGEPMMGSGLVFSVPPELIRVDPFEIPAHWARINGIDFGWEHPFACAFIAWDREGDKVYVYDGYKEKRTLPAIHADAIKQRGDWIPISWPKDGLQTEKGSGNPLSEVYRRQGLNMHPTFFTNPAKMGEEEGKGGVSVEAGILEMMEMMETGRFKVFSNVSQFWEELGMYHRKDGKIVPLFDDFISACRYAVMFRRHAQTKTVLQPKQKIRKGARNW